MPNDKNLPSKAPTDITYHLPIEISELRDETEIIKDTNQKVKDQLRGQIEMAETASRLLKKTIDQAEDLNPATAGLVISELITALSATVNLMSKAHSKYMECNYIPTGNISIAEIIKKGGTVVPVNGEGKPLSPLDKDDLF